MLRIDLRVRKIPPATIALGGISEKRIKNQIHNDHANENRHAQIKSFPPGGQDQKRNRRADDQAKPNLLRKSLSHEQIATTAFRTGRKRLDFRFGGSLIHRQNGKRVSRSRCNAMISPMKIKIPVTYRIPVADCVARRLMQSYAM